MNVQQIKRIYMRFIKIPIALHYVYFTTYILLPSRFLAFLDVKLVAGGLTSQRSETRLQQMRRKRPVFCMAECDAVRRKQFLRKFSTQVETHPDDMHTLRQPATANIFNILCNSKLCRCSVAALSLHIARFNCFVTVHLTFSLLST